MDAEIAAARAQAKNNSTEALIGHLKLEIEKLRRALYGHRSERQARLLAQMCYRDFLGEIPLAEKPIFDLREIEISY